MDNPEKLIRAWLKCEGYEIEEIYNQRKRNYECALAAEANKSFFKTHEDFIDYKVTKKAEPQSQTFSFTQGMNPMDFGESIL